MAPVKYFAYGNNMAPEVMAARSPGARLLGAAYLPGHRLAFTRRSIRTHTGVADLVPDGDAEVWGALYELGDEDFEELDRREGAGWAYTLTPVTVRLAADGRPTEAVAYTVVEPDAPHVQPSEEYLERLIASARSLDLPNEYISDLERIRGRG